MSNTVKEIQINAATYNTIESRLSSTKFDSVSEYADYVLNGVVSEVQERSTADEAEEIDEKEVQNRLEALGYLNE